MNLFENLQMMKESENNISYNKYKSMITRCVNTFNSKIEKVQQKVEYLIDNNLLNDFIFKNHPHSEDVLNEIKHSGSDVSTITSLLLMWDSLVEVPIDIYVRWSEWDVSDNDSKINLDDWLYFSIYNYYQEDYDDIREKYMSGNSFIDKELYENELTMFNNANTMMDKLQSDVITESNSGDINLQNITIKQALKTDFNEDEDKLPKDVEKIIKNKATELQKLYNEKLMPKLNKEFISNNLEEFGYDEEDLDELDEHDVRDILEEYVSNLLSNPNVPNGEGDPFEMIGDRISEDGINSKTTIIDYCDEYIRIYNTEDEYVGSYVLFIACLNNMIDKLKNIK